jgi:hypothetical protein
MSERELRGTARVLRQTIPDVVAFNRVSIPFLEQARALSACTNSVLVPFMDLKVPNPDESGNDGQPVRAQLQRGFPGLAGESRLSDGNNQMFHAGANLPGNRVRPGPPPDGGSQPPPHRPDVPCETQELPDLNAPGGPIPKFPVLERSAGTVTRGPAPAVSQSDFLAAVRDFAKEGWPAIEKARRDYAEREAKARARQEDGR